MFTLHAGACSLGLASCLLALQLLAGAALADSAPPVQLPRSCEIAANPRVVNTYFSAGRTAVRMIPGRPADQINVGAAWSRLNDTPCAWDFFFPDVPSTSKDFRYSEFMFQTVYQTTIFFPVDRGSWSLSPALSYTCSWTPG